MSLQFIRIGSKSTLQLHPALLTLTGFPLSVAAMFQGGTGHRDRKLSASSVMKLQAKFECQNPYSIQVELSNLNLGSVMFGLRFVSST